MTLQAKLFSSAPQGSDEWIQARKAGVGASDAAAALGLSKWKSPYQLWAEKTGNLPAQSDNWFMKRGRTMEPLLRQHYAERMGENVLYIDGILQHKDCPVMLASLDGYTESGRLAEFKTASSRNGWGEAGTDEIPIQYMIQVQAALDVSGLEVADVGVSFNGDEPQYYEVRADAELQAIIRSGLRSFWEKVQSAVEPDPLTVAEFQKKYAITAGATLIADETMQSSYSELLKVRRQIKELSAQEESLEDEIKKALAVSQSDTLIDARGVKLLAWTEGKGRESVDGKKLKAENPTLYEAYKTIGNPYRTFRVYGE